MFKCPYCKRKGISLPQKLFLLIARRFYKKTSCRYCNNTVTSPIICSILLFVFFVCFIWSTDPGTELFEKLITITLFIMFLLISIFVIPLMKYPD